MTDLGNINIWLALIAVASLIQTSMLVAAVYVAWRASRQAKEMVERFERQQLDPLVGHVHAAVTDVREVVARARSIEHDVRDRVRETSVQMTSRIWPAIAASRAVRAAYMSLTHPAPARVRSTTFKSTGR